MTNPHEPVIPHTDGTLRFSDGSELKLTERDRPKCPWCHAFGFDPDEQHRDSCNTREEQKVNYLLDRVMEERQELADWEKVLLADGPVQAQDEPTLDLKAKLAAERRKVQRLQDTVRGFELPEPKPPRIRTLELPGEINPDTHELTVNFAIVLDRMGDLTVHADQLDRLADETGARTAVSFPFEIQIGEDGI